MQRGIKTPTELTNQNPNKISAPYARESRRIIGGAMPTLKLITKDDVYEVPGNWFQTKGNYPIKPSIMKQNSLKHSPLQSVTPTSSYDSLPGIKPDLLA